MVGLVAPAARRGPLERLAGSSLGRKYVMAITGLVMLGFLVGHLSGNLLVFAGADALNAYAQWLKDHPGLLWTARIVLLLALVAHMGAAMRLARENAAARPRAYAAKSWREASWASRHMLMTGLLVFLYVVYHLLHFTFHAIDTGGMGLKDAAGRVDVYSMVVEGFRVHDVEMTYIAAHVVLDVHIWHAVPSVFQTLGLDHKALRPLANKGGPALAVALAAGYIAIPVAIWAGCIGRAP